MLGGIKGGMDTASADKAGLRRSNRSSYGRQAVVSQDVVVALGGN